MLADDIHKKDAIQYRLHGNQPQTQRPKTSTKQNVHRPRRLQTTAFADLNISNTKRRQTFTNQNFDWNIAKST